MKPIHPIVMLTRSLRLQQMLAFGAAVVIGSSLALADAGRGSIRAAARPEPAPRAAPAREAPARQAPAARPEARPEPRPEARPAPRPEARPAPRPEARPQARPEVRSEVHPAPARVEVPARRDWDNNDEDARHFGGFARPGPVHIARGVRVHDLPPRHFDIPWHDHHYFWDPAGVFYLADPDGQFEVVQPPVGIPVNTLPDDATAIPYNGVTYYYLDGTFFAPSGDTYAVVDPPPGIVVPTLPDGATQVDINGIAVFQFNGFNYTPTLQDGVTAYVVTPS